MKLTTIFLLLFVFGVQANSHSQSVTLSGKSISLENMLTAIRKQTNYAVLISRDLLKEAKPVDVDVQNMPLAVFLETILEKQQLDYIIDAESILILKKKEQPTTTEAEREVVAAPIQITIKDEAGNPLPMATIVVKGTKQVLVTNEQGQVSFDYVSGATLIVSYVGYETQTVTLKDEKPVTIQLKLVPSRMEEVNVVHTGYQQLPKERATGSFATADMKTLRDRNATTNILEQLDGLIPGLTVNPAPGAEKFLIRGLNSIQGNRAPLIVVDGVAVEDISAINAHDVENITVLKDATAASIWGARAANGVIVITSRKGRSNDRVQVEYNGSYTHHGRPDVGYHNYMDSKEFVATAKELFDPVYNSWSQMSVGYFIMPHELIMYNRERNLISDAQANASLDSLAGINNRDQINQFWVRNAATNNQTISVRGGGKVHSFYGSLNYINSQSNTYGDANHQYKVNLRQDFNLHKKLQVHLITDLTAGNSKSKRPMRVGANYLPYQLFQDANGNPIDLNYTKFSNPDIQLQRETETKVDLNYFPLLEMDRGETNRTNLLARIVAGVNLEIVKGLKFEGLYGYVHGNNRSTDLEMENSYTTRYKVATLTAPPTNPGGDLVRYIPKDGAIYTVNNGNARQWTVRNQLSYNFAKNDHQFNVLFGQEAQQVSNYSDRSRVFGYNPQMMTHANINYAALMDGNNIPGGYFGYMYLNSEDAYYMQTDQLSRFVSYYSLGSYAYKGRYILNGSWRIDESNLFGKDRAAQARPVWSIGGKWLMDEEAFMASNNIFRNLALRATIGITGNSPLPGSAASFDIISSYISPREAGGVIYYVDVPGNPGLTWESTNVKNFGVDFTLVGNRISGSVDYYNKKTSGLIGNYPLNMLTGYSTTIGNLGDLTNRGVELSLNTVNIQTSQFTWNSTLNVSYNKNEITNLTATGVPGIGTSYIQGYPAFTVFAYDYAGLDANGNPKIRLANGNVTSARVNSYLEDWRYMGTTQPVWNGGFFNTFQYKNFALNVNMIFNLGHVMRRDIQHPFTNGRLTENISREFADRWKPGMDTMSTMIPGYITSTALNQSQRNINYYLQGSVNTISASYVKIRDIGLHYNVPASVLQRARIQNLTFRVQMHNVMLWANNRYGIDPEFRGNTPTNQRSMSVGLRTQF